MTLWNVIANLDMEPITLLGRLALSGSLLTKIAYSGTDQLPSVNDFTTIKLPSIYVNTCPKITEINMFVKEKRSQYVTLKVLHMLINHNLGHKKIKYFQFMFGYIAYYH